MVEQLFQETDITAEDVAAGVAADCPVPEGATPPEETVLVSVVVPVYNAAPYLAQALDSLCAQTLTDIEIICVDDGSTDGCLDILKGYRDADARVRILTQNNAGPSRARNAGLRRARGEYVAFLDADDFAEPRWLQVLYTIAHEQDVDIVVSGYDLYRDRIQRYTAAIASERADKWPCGVVVPRSDIPDVLLQATDGYAWNKLFRRSFLLEKDVLFPDDILMFEDAYFVATALSMADRLYKAEDILLHHRVYQEQVRNRLFLKNYIQVIDVFTRLRAHLVRHGMYLPLRATYANASASRCYKVYNLLGADEKRRFWNRLHESAETLGWDVQTPGMLEDTDVAEFVANVEVYTYEQYFPRLLRGVSFRIERFVRSFRSVQKRQRRRRFFGRLFHRQKPAPDETEQG